MNPTTANIRGENTHSYPALDYPVGVGTGLVACMPGTIRDMPGVATRQLFGGMQNGDAWPTLASNPNGRHSGNVINIDHGGGVWTSYLHDSPYDVNVLRGRTVKQGEVFGKSGNNGWSTGPHLHFEVVINGVKVDPQKWLDSIKQGGDMPSKVDIDRVNELFVAFWTRPQIEAEATKAGKTVDQWLQGWVGTESNSLIKSLAESPQYRNKRLDAENEVAVLKKQVADCEAGGTVLGPGTYKVN